MIYTTNKKIRITPESIQKPFWAMKTEEVFAVLETSSSGLSEREVKLRRASFGSNTITEKKRFTALKLFLNQFRSPLILILCAAGGVTLFLREWVEAGVIIAAITVNIGLGFYQETKAEGAIGALKSYIRTRVRVRREGRDFEVDGADLVPGDIIRISQGDRVPTDARIFFANNLEIDESVLTGESLPSLKDSGELATSTALGERKCIAFGGSLAVSGFGDAVVIKTGDLTEFGKIAALVENRVRDKTPLEKAMSSFALNLGAVLGVLVVILFLLGINAGRDPFEMFLIGVAVAVSAVPEGLPVALTVILATGVQRLASKKGIVRRLLAAETLGSTNLILTDKTGTLTQAKMELSRVIPYGVGGLEEERHILTDAILTTDVAIENPSDPPRYWRLFGKPLEVALIRGAAAKWGVYISGVLKEHRITDRLPFSSVYKFSAAVVQGEGHSHFVIFGAPEVLLSFTDLSKEVSTSLHAQISSLAGRGERVLGIVSRPVPPDLKKISKEGLKNFKFRGLISFRDPLRPAVAEAIQKMKAAGVDTVIVTGDHKGTAEAVARDLGLVDGKGAVLTGDDLNYLKKEEWLARAGEVTVYARVTPEQKVLITKLYQEQGKIVAVTGDGINDAPALNQADIGVAVGSGTDVAKNAADLIILDDNFETIVAAIEEGRRILDNIRKVMVYLLSNSLDELLLIGGSLLFGLALPLNALQILFVNFFSDSFPAIAFAFEKGVDGLGSSPRKLHKNLFDRKVRFLIMVIGVFTSLLLFLLYAYLLYAGFPEDLVRSFIFATFSTYSLILVFSLRSLDKAIFSYNPFSNLYLVGGVALGLALTGLAVYLPLLQNILHTVPLPYGWLLGVLGVGLANILGVEFGKWLFRRNIL
jgi:Ca2+-transporting ATPase